ncbi:SDR family oxidoreductase [Motilimonas eburnea]|uniref:SDR family oxidoreductase n=1 Tax=Motilimonas eburnea TaxID=1737488 RepID=UPI001E2AE589|nr:SDR family oxidoreductase [Motilimonas eburnea]MCE2571573.1 SDR family oxidoreductase [Motilimonas eburnea]
MRPIILITGCSTGIGLYCAKQLAQAGYQVFATARKPDDLNQLAQLGCHPVYMDMTKEDSITQGLEQVLAATHGRIDILFNNAAYGQPGAVEDLPTSALRQQFETNLFGWHTLTRAVIHVMRQQGQGKIIQNSSVLGLVAMPYRGAYIASKFALEGLTDTLRLELRGSNISISLIEPGPITSQFRATALAAFKQHIDIEKSVHAPTYQQTLQRLGASKGENRFTLGPDAVYKALISIINSKQPKARYYVTTPTSVFAIFKRILPHSWLDFLLSKSA